MPYPPILIFQDPLPALPLKGGGEIILEGENYLLESQEAPMPGN
jgi:hypothetical protein